MRLRDPYGRVRKVRVSINARWYYTASVRTGLLRRQEYESSSARGAELGLVRKMYRQGWQDA